MVTGEYMAPGATVIDVGMNRVTDRAEAARLGKAEEFERKGSVLVGDVHPLDVARVASALYAGAGRRGPADHRHADGQHRGAGRAASGGGRIS